jgi:hypothetical protein
MDLSIYTTELRDNLTAAASLGDEPTQRAAAALAAALEPASRLALMHALSDLAAEVTAQLAATGRPIDVDVRIDGRDLRVVTRDAGPTASSASSFSAAATTDGEAPAAADAASPSSAAAGDGHDRTFAEAGGDLTRTTVRMFNELKGRAEKAAAEQGVSLNSFISKAVAESIRTDLPRKWKDKAERHDRETPRGSTINGYVQG